MQWDNNNNGNDSGSNGDPLEKKHSISYNWHTLWLYILDQYQTPGPGPYQLVLRLMAIVQAHENSCRLCQIDHARILLVQKLTLTVELEVLFQTVFRTGLRLEMEC